MLGYVVIYNCYTIVTHFYHLYTHLVIMIAHSSNYYSPFFLFIDLNVEGPLTRNPDPRTVLICFYLRAK